MILALIIFILIFSFLIISHEFGHFIAAKKAGVRVEEFGIGYPPRAFGKKIGGTIYSINWIPFGGFVKIYGEDLEGNSLKDPKSFTNKPPKIKAAILLAGVTVNILAAIVIFYFLLGFSGFKTFQTQIANYKFPFGEQKNFAGISYIVPNSPADLAGIKPYDIVLAIDNQEIKNSEELSAFIKAHKDQEIILSLKNLRTGQERLVRAVPKVVSPQTEAAIGIGIGDISRLSYNSVPEKIFSGFIHTANLTHFSIYALGHLIKTSIIERDIGPISSSVAGPVGILALTKLTMAGGAWQIFNLIAVISLALAVANLLPIPAADGGRLVFVVYEAIFRKRAPVRLERSVNIIGFFILILLLCLVTVKDIIQFKDILF